jgi:hypothetical protein
MEIFHTVDNFFANFKDFLIIPFGFDYIAAGISPVELGAVYPDETILQFNCPCAIVDKSAKTPLRLKDLPKIFPYEILPINHDNFRDDDNHIIAKKYYDYLVKFYKDVIITNSKMTDGESDFFDIYFDFCFNQLKYQSENYYNKENIRSLAEKYKKDEEYLYGRVPSSYPTYPLNDGRVLFEVLLPLFEAHVSVKSIAPKAIFHNGDDVRKNVNYGYTTKEKLIPLFSRVNNATKPSQRNKDFIHHTKIDCCFWDGEKLLAYEIDGNKKLLADYELKHSNLRNSKIELKSISNSAIFEMKNYLTELSPDPKSVRIKLNKLGIPEQITNFWETVPSSDPVRKLLPIGFYNGSACGNVRYDFIPEYKDVSLRQFYDIYLSIPYHFSTMSTNDQTFEENATDNSENLLWSEPDGWTFLQDYDLSDFGEYIFLDSIIK